jgi:hypothetical protein
MGRGVFWFSLRRGKRKDEQVQEPHLRPLRGTNMGHPGVSV